MTELAEPDRGRSPATGRDADAGTGVEADDDAEPSPGTGPEAVADRIRDRGERVRRRELDAALRRLESGGEVTPGQRRVLAKFSTRLAGALVEQWASRLADDEGDADAALALLTE